VVLAFDEAQLLHRTPVNFPMLFAHVYDYLKNTLLVLTGSEVGLLHDFLGLEDSDAPLYGRHREEIRLQRFDEATARDFLLKGFEQVGVLPPGEVLDYAVSRLDGIVGWLTEFGNRASKNPTKEAVEEVLREGKKLVLQELEHFLGVRGAAKGRYMAILRRLARGPLSWEQLKEWVEREEGRPIYNKNFSDLLANLVKAGFVEQRERLYSISDPVLAHALS
jgi:AAA+ ATPase superfamily predicted ATPase